MHTRRVSLLLAPAALLIGQEKKKLDKGPPLEAALVKEFVGAAHAKLDRTKEMLAERPSLLNATWDWGGGDFETGLGGAAHMGNREIALFLIGQGARTDIFSVVMFGQLDVVKALVKAFPGIEKSLGPHKIPLLAHAKRGGAEEVVGYLESLNR